MLRPDLIVLAAALGLQQPVPTQAPRTGPDSPVNDPVTVRGCLEGHHLKILESDATDLSGIRDIRLKGPRGVMRSLDDYRGAYVEVAGLLDLGRPDRIETRRTIKAGSKTTISIGASAEQISGQPPIADPILIVNGFQPLGERCPGR